MKRVGQHRKLKTEFLVNALITTTLLFVVAIGIVIVLNIRMYEDEIHFKNGLVSQSLISQLDEHSFNQIRALENFSYDHESDPTRARKDVEERLNRLLEYDEMFIRIQILDPEGIVSHSSFGGESNVGMDLSLQPYVSILETAGDYFYSNTFFSRDYDRVLASLSYKSDKNIYVTDLDLFHFSQHIDVLPINDQLEYILVDHKGTIVSSSLTSLVDIRSKFSFFERSKGLVNDFEYVTIDGHKYLMNTAFSEAMSWTIIILNDSKVMMQPVYMMVVVSLAISVVMIVLIFVFQKKRIDYVIHKLNELNANLSLIKKGVYDVVFLDTQFEEFNTLANHFVKSTDEIQVREEEIKSLNTNLEGIVEARTAELSEKNEALKAIVHELQDTQEMLVESEKWHPSVGLLLVLPMKLTPL